jgi:hypothetical protein
MDITDREEWGLVSWRYSFFRLRFEAEKCLTSLSRVAALIFVGKIAVVEGGKGL